MNHLVENPVGLKLPKGLPLNFEENRKGGMEASSLDGRGYGGGKAIPSD